MSKTVTPTWNEMVARSKAAAGRSTIEDEAKAAATRIASGSFVRHSTIEDDARRGAARSGRPSEFVRVQPRPSEFVPVQARPSEFVPVQVAAPAPARDPYLAPHEQRDAEKKKFVSDAANAYLFVARQIRREGDALHAAQDRVKHAAPLTSEYEAADRDLATLEANSTKCPLSLETFADTGRFLDWILIQVTDKIRQYYWLDEFIKYCMRYPVGMLIPDPTRTLPNLNHMRARAQHIARLPEHARALTVQDYSDELLDRKLLTIFEKVIAGVPLKNIPEVDMGILMNIGVWERAGYIHNVESGAEGKFFMGKPVGTWMMRKSSKSVFNPTRTVFTLCINRESQIDCYRMLLIHGVGIYNLTGALGGKDPIKMTATELDSKDFAGMLATIEYHEPAFTCIMEMLKDCASNAGLVLAHRFRTCDVPLPQ